MGSDWLLLFSSLGLQTCCSKDVVIITAAHDSCNGTSTVHNPDCCCYPHPHNF
jgi:hypothetical protein